MPTALRMVRDLVAWGGLERARDGSYRLGQRLWTLGVQVPCHRRIRETAARHIARLTGAEIATAVASSAMLLKGERFPLHATAVGKVLLAQGVEPGELSRCTPYTITEHMRLSRVVAEVKRTGMAFEREELRLGWFAVAVSIPNIQAAIGVRAPSTADLRRMVPALRQAAERITSDLA